MNKKKLLGTNKKKKKLNNLIKKIVKGYNKYNLLLNNLDKFVNKKDIYLNNIPSSLLINEKLRKKFSEFRYN